MSYSHTQRCKTVKRFKEKWGGKNWYARFVEHIARIVSERLGPPILITETGEKRARP